MHQRSRGSAFINVWCSYLSACIVYTVGYVFFKCVQTWIVPRHFLIIFDLHVNRLSLLFSVKENMLKCSSGRNHTPQMHRVSRASLTCVWLAQAASPETFGKWILLDGMHLFLKSVYGSQKQHEAKPSSEKLGGHTRHTLTIAVTT